MRTTISSRGLTAVPAAIRKHFELSASSRLEWLIDGELITILPVPAEPARAFRGSLQGVYSGRKLLKERGRERRRERLRS